MEMRISHSFPGIALQYVQTDDLYTCGQRRCLNTALAQKTPIQHSILGLAYVRGNEQYMMCFAQLKHAWIMSRFEGYVELLENIITITIGFYQLSQQILGYPRSLRHWQQAKN